MIWFRSIPFPDPPAVGVLPSGGREHRSKATCRSRTLTLISLTLVAGLGLSRRGDLGDAAGVLTDSTPVPILMAVGLSLLGVLNRAEQFRAAQAIAGLGPDLRSMLRITSASYALNKVVKTGGLGGVALFVRHGRRRGQPTGSVLAACVVNSLSNQVGMLVVALMALCAVVAEGSLSRSWSFAAAGLALLVIAAAMALAAVAMGNRSVVERWYPTPFAVIARVAGWFGLSAPATPDPGHLDRFYRAIATVRADPRSSLPILAHAVAAKLIGAAVLACSLWAVGASIGPGPVLIVYVVALIAAATTILPGGLGAVEATMALILAGYGVPTATALAATIIFRLLDLWVPVLIGLMAAPGLDHSAIRAGTRTIAAEAVGSAGYASPTDPTEVAATTTSTSIGSDRLFEVSRARTR